MFIDIEFESPVNKRMIKYQKRLPEIVEDQIRELLEIISQKNSMIILPVAVKVIDNDKTFSTTVFVSTLVERTGCVLDINNTKPEEAPEVREDNNDYTNHETFFEKVGRIFNEIIDTVWYNQSIS